MNVNYSSLEGSLMFSPDSKHVIYVAEVGKKQVVAVDGNPGKPYDSIMTSGGRSVVLDSPDSFHYLATKHAGDALDVVLVEERLG